MDSYSIDFVIGNENTRLSKLISSIKVVIMSKYYIVLLISSCFVIASGGVYGARIRLVATAEGSTIEEETGLCMEDPTELDFDCSPQIIWHYTSTDWEGSFCPMGSNSQFVFVGGFKYPGTSMFQGMGGDGTILWSYSPEYCPPHPYSITLAAETSSNFYSIQSWEGAGSGGGYEINSFNEGSPVPLWTYIDPLFLTGGEDYPGYHDCSADGSVLAISGIIDGHMAIHFFNPENGTPFSTYEDENLLGAAHLRLTSDGSKCLIRNFGVLYRVDTATGELEATLENFPVNLNCFAISPDGSVVVNGSLDAEVAVWNGTSYTPTATINLPAGYLASCATVAADNSTVYFGFFRSDCLSNIIIRYDISSSTVKWQYKFEECTSGDLQDIVSWIDCSADGRWVAASSWGGGMNGGEDEILVFDDQNPAQPVFSIDTPGSMWSVDISDDGSNLTAVGRLKHANIFDCSTDLYMLDLDFTGIEANEEGSNLSVSITPNPSRGSFSALVTTPSAGTSELQLLDLTGRCIYTSDIEHGVSTEINVCFPAGVYLCKATGNHETVVNRLVILE